MHKLAALYFVHFVIIIVAFQIIKFIARSCVFFFTYFRFLIHGKNGEAVKRNETLGVQNQSNLFTVNCKLIFEEDTTHSSKSIFGSTGFCGFFSPDSIEQSSAVAEGFKFERNRCLEQTAKRSMSQFVLQNTCVKRKGVLELGTQGMNFLLSSDKKQNSSLWQLSVDFAHLQKNSQSVFTSCVSSVVFPKKLEARAAHLSVRLANVVVHWGSFVEMYCDRKLSRVNLECTHDRLSVFLSIHRMTPLRFKFISCANAKKSDPVGFTLSTGGVTLNSLLFSVKSSTLSVADMMMSFSGFPLYKTPPRFNQKGHCVEGKTSSTAASQRRTLCLRGTMRDRSPMRMSV